MDNPTESNNRELLLGALERLLRETDHQNWSLITEIGYNLSEEGRRQLVADAIASLKSLPELNTFFQAKTHNVQCPVDRCGTLLPIQEHDRGVVLCTCRNYYLCVHWEDGDAIVGALHPSKRTSFSPSS